jgi:hypothetical protein
LRRIEICQRCEKFEAEVIATASEIVPELLALMKRDDEGVGALRRRKRAQRDAAK